MRIKTDRAVRSQRETTIPDADVPVATRESVSVCLVDEALARFGCRELVAGSEVVDMLLDLRSAMGSRFRID